MLAPPDPQHLNVTSNLLKLRDPRLEHGQITSTSWTFPAPGLCWGSDECFSSPLLMKEWCLGCWSLSQDWPNTRWTSGWPETCSWRLKSGSHTDLWETESPLHLRGKVHASVRPDYTPCWAAATCRGTCLGGASVSRPAGPPDSR